RALSLDAVTLKTIEFKVTVSTWFDKHRQLLYRSSIYEFSKAHSLDGIHSPVWSTWSMHPMNSQNAVDCIEIFEIKRQTPKNPERDYLNKRISLNKQLASLATHEKFDDKQPLR